MQRYGKSAEIQNNSRFISFSADNILSLHSFISMKMVAVMKKLLFVLSLFFLSLTIQAQVDSYWSEEITICFILVFPVADNSGAGGFLLEALSEDWIHSREVS